MGQQQILFLLLGVCVLGVSISVGLVGQQRESDPANEGIVLAELGRIASRAQEYYQSPIQSGGGEGSFLHLTATPDGIRKLIVNPSSLYADYFLQRTNTSRYLRITAVGFSPGRNPSLPLCLEMTVWPESTAVVVLN